MMVFKLDSHTEQSRLVIGPYELVPYVTPEMLISNPIKQQSDAPQYWAIPGCTKEKPEYVTTKRAYAAAHELGFKVEPKVVVLLNRV
ncbi:MAG: hypothetical protein ACWGQW_10530, partial [bacterium]